MGTVPATEVEVRRVDGHVVEVLACPSDDPDLAAVMEPHEAHRLAKRLRDAANSAEGWRQARKS
jgi:hypothetical protein